MTWDDEFMRALASAPALRSVPRSVEHFASRYELTPSKCIDAAVSLQFFKAELRRMLTFH